uniref:Uncharacterized protein n=1 Tax=Oryza brachyantha TaxID=4533 RepID=J3LZE5_ORYBR
MVSRGMSSSRIRSEQTGAGGHQSHPPFPAVKEFSGTGKPHAKRWGGGDKPPPLPESREPPGPSPGGSQEHTAAHHHPPTGSRSREEKKRSRSLLFPTPAPAPRSARRDTKAARGTAIEEHRGAERRTVMRQRRQLTDA